MQPSQFPVFDVRWIYHARDESGEWRAVEFEWPHHPAVTAVERFLAENYQDLTLMERTIPTYNLALLLDDNVDEERRKNAAIRLLEWYKKIPHRLTHPLGSVPWSECQVGRPGILPRAIQAFKTVLDKTITDIWFEYHGTEWPTQSKVLELLPLGMSESTFYRRLATIKELGLYSTWSLYVDAVLSQDN